MTNKRPTVTIKNPYSGEILSEQQLISDRALEAAVSRASALHSAGAPPIYVRKQVLQKLYLLMKAHANDLIACAIAEGGKPYKDTAVEMDRALNSIEVALQTLATRAGREIPMQQNNASKERVAYTRIQPIGPVFAVSAFNHPINLTIHQVVPAIAVGAPILFKPARKTPLTAAKIFSFIEEIQRAVPAFPPHFCQYILCTREQTSQLIEDPRIGYISFIGSPEVGWKMRQDAAPGTRLGLELGGTGNVLIGEALSERHALSAVKKIVKGGFYHAGQVCVSVQAVHIPEAARGFYEAALVREIKRLRSGNPADPQTDVGPLIDPASLQRIDQLVQSAQAKGARVAVGGEPLQSNCYKPTLLVFPKGADPVNQEEFFGPLVSLYSYPKGGLKEHIRALNRSRFSFQASLFSDQLGEILLVSNTLETVALMVNDHTAFRVDWMPFGGQKSSGLGVGGIPYTMADMCYEQLIVWAAPGV